MPPDPARLGLAQVVVSVLAVLVATVVATLLVFRRGPSPRLGVALLCTCAVAAVAAWVRFGAMHVVPMADVPGGPRTEHHVPFQFHEFFHYYVGPKYFRELGYLGLYDCTALADEEIAEEDHRSPRLRDFVRDLGDVLAAKTIPVARADCMASARPRFSSARWLAFETDIRALQTLVPDEWWADVTNDKGLNPPPTSVLLEAAVANAIPIRAGGLPTYLLTTSIDGLLIVASFLALRTALGANAALLGAVTFGASFLASYGWLGGAVLRFTWVFALTGSLALMRRGRWAFAGALMGWAICDRVFPVAFAAGAVVPLAWQARHSLRRRSELLRFVLGVAAVVGIAVAVAAVVFGTASFELFATRLARDARVHNVLHIGLDKILTFRSWTPSQSFGGYDGLVRFRHWNERVNATWHDVRFAALGLQVLVLALATRASLGRHPIEASVLLGVTGMFTLASPSSYYYVILALVPAVLFRRAWVAAPARRVRDLAVLLAFEGFWLVTLVAPQVMRDAIVFDLIMCVALAAALAVWTGEWNRASSATDHERA